MSITIKNVSKIDEKVILQVESLSNGNIKLYGVYNLADKFNIRINNIISSSDNIVKIEIQLIDNYNKIMIGDRMTLLN